MLSGWLYALLGLLIAVLVAGGQRALTGEVNWVLVTVTGALFAIGSGILWPIWRSTRQLRRMGANIQEEFRLDFAEMRGAFERPDADRYHKFTERARRVLTLAQEEAQRFNHNYIGTEHLLLGLVREGDGVAAKVLANLGVKLQDVRSAVEFIIGRGDCPILGEIGLTPRAKKVIDYAIDEGRRLNHNYIGTEHLLLGLVREGEGIAAGVLESLGVNLERLRTETTRLLSQSMPSSTPSARATDDDEGETESEIDVTSRIFAAPMRRVLALAREEAMRFSQPLISPSHLFLGLLRDKEGLAARVLTHLAVQTADLRRSVEESLVRGNSVVLGDLDFDLDAEKLMQVAISAAQAEACDHTGTEHLLLAFVTQRGSMVERTLRAFGITPSRVREAISTIRAADGPASGYGGQAET
jgi:ATP-dependent Clp protease ATP-binding subunit ClpA